MTVATYEKVKKELKRELLAELSVLFVRYAKDPEGEYRAEFVKKILKLSAKKSQPTYKYSRKTFLQLIS